MWSRIPVFTGSSSDTNYDYRETKMIVLKLAILTCGFYLGISILVETALFVAARMKEGFMFYATLRGWAVFFAIVWVLSFGLAWRIVVGGLRARFVN